MSDNSNDLGAFLAGFVIGGLVGAATAIILAPQSGAETRAQIAAKGQEIAQTGNEQYHHYLDTASSYTSEYKDRAETALQNASGRVQDQARIVLDRGNSSDAAATDASQTDDSQGETV